MVRSKVDMDLKIASTIKRKDRLVKKLKPKFGEGVAEVEDEEDDEDDEDGDEKGEGPLALTQGMGEDVEEGVE